jgi:hypothetical protein
MPTYMASSTAAVAIVGADLFDGETWSRSPRNRALVSFGMVGSTNPADTGVELRIDETRVGAFFNSRGGANLSPNKDDIFALENLFIPAGAQVRCVVTDAAATNAVITAVGIEDR